MSNSILELNDITYTYDGEVFSVWEHLSCSFYQNKINAIVGPSGCGKSSILNTINGLIPHVYQGNLKGKVILEGKDVTDITPPYRCDDIGLVMQNPESQFCTFTVEEELAFGMENLEVPKDEMEARIKKMLSFIEMEGFEEVDLNNLSGGQKQKVAIASIVITRPKVLILDEPTANLDPQNRSMIFELIIKLTKEENTTIIIVEHNIAEIIDDVSRIIILDDKGKVILEKDKDDISKDELLSMNVIYDPPKDYIKLQGKPKDIDPILNIKNLSFSYKSASNPIVKDMSFCVYPGDFLAITGENGVGKTTLMKLIFKILKPNSGEIEIFGKNYNQYKTKDLYKKIGLVFQNPEEQFVANTVYEEMAFSFKTTKISEEDKKLRIDNMLKRFHLDEYKEQSPFVLSQGQKRRLSVACMLLTNQEILFLDEPTYGQDYENRQELMKDMEKLISEGVTIVMITHDMDLVKQYATRVINIKDGRATEK